MWVDLVVGGAASWGRSHVRLLKWSWVWEEVEFVAIHDVDIPGGDGSEVSLHYLTPPAAAAAAA